MRDRKPATTRSRIKRWLHRISHRPGQSRGLASTTVRSIHTTLHHALRIATLQGLIPTNPADEVDPPKVVHKPMKLLNDEQSEKFMEEIKRDELWHDFFYTELTTGLRRGKICGLMWSDFDERTGSLQVNRTLRSEKGGRLGHADPGFTLRTYTHATNKMQAEAAQTVGQVFGQHL